MTTDEISAIISKSGTGRDSLISILEEIQAKHSYLPEDALRRVAEETGRSLVDVYGVATFYRSFSLKPRGKHLISVCLGTACHVRGGPTIAAEIERCLGIRSGETTADNEFTLETVNCLGACALGPVMVVDGRYFPSMKPSMVPDVIDRVKTGLDTVEIDSDQRVFPLEVSCARCNHSLMDSRHLVDGHPAIRVTASFGSNHGRLLLSCLYGSHKVESQHELPDDTIIQLFCPHCHAELIGSAKCTECSASMVPMIVRGGGIVQICTRSGCKGHMLDLGGATVE
ncbi:MAG: NAD(P)H-dependent oxidoreductase subunit E [bacterium]